MTDPGAHPTGDATGRAARGVAVRDVVTVLGTLLALGVVGGVLWWLLVDPAAFTKTAEGGAMGETDLGRRFNADGWYVVLGAAGGLLAGLGLTAWRRRDPLLTSGLLVLGSALAAGVMVLVGHLLGPSGTGAALQAAAVGARVPEPLQVDTWLLYLGWPVGALAGALFVLLGRAPAALAPADSRADPT